MEYNNIQCIVPDNYYHEFPVEFGMDIELITL